MKKIIIGAMLLSLVGLVGCQASSEEVAVETVVEESVEQEASLEHLVLTYVTAPLNVPSIIEKDQKILEEIYGDLGTSIAYAEITSGADQTQALASGDVQILNAVGATSVILSAANGADIKVLSMYSRSPKAFSMYAKEELATPESLRGKTIGGPAGTNLHQLLIAYLATGDMTIDDVNYVNMTIPDAKAALDGGSVDVALLAGATGYTAEQQGYHMVADGDGLIDAIIAVAVTNEFYENNKDMVDAFVEGQAAIASFMEENKEEVIAIVAKELDLDENAVQDMLSFYDFSTEITEEDRAGFRRTADFMLESEMMEQDIDIEDLFF